MKKAFPLLFLSFLYFPALSQSMEAEDVDCPCAKEIEQRFERDKEKYKLDMQCYTMCIYIDIRKCQLSCTDEPDRRSEIQRVISQMESNTSAVGCPCNSFSGSFSGNYGMSPPSNNWGSSNSTFNISDSYFNSTYNPYGHLDANLYDNTGFSLQHFDGSMETSVQAAAIGLIKTIDKGELDGDLIVGGVGIVANVIDQKRERERQEEEYRQQQEEERQRILEEERIKQEKMKEQRIKYISHLNDATFPIEAPNVDNYFFFVVQEEEQILSFSEIFNAPAKFDNSLPYKSDLISDFKRSKNKEKVWVQGVFESEEHAKAAKKVIAGSALNHSFQFADEIPYKFTPSYSTATSQNATQNEVDYWGTKSSDKNENNSKITEQTQSSNNYWGISKGVKKEEQNVGSDKENDESEGESSNSDNFWGVSKSEKMERASERKEDFPEISSQLIVSGDDNAQAPSFLASSLTEEEEIAILEGYWMRLQDSLVLYFKKHPDNAFTGYRVDAGSSIWRYKGSGYNVEKGTVYVYGNLDQTEELDYAINLKDIRNVPGQGWVCDVKYTKVAGKNRMIEMFYQPANLQFLNNGCYIQVEGNIVFRKLTKYKPKRLYARIDPINGLEEEFTIADVEYPDNCEEPAVHENSMPLDYILVEPSTDNHSDEKVAGEEDKPLAQNLKRYPWCMSENEINNGVNPEIKVSLELASDIAGNYTSKNTDGAESIVLSLNEDGTGNYFNQSTATSIDIKWGLYINREGKLILNDREAGAKHYKMLITSESIEKKLTGLGDGPCGIDWIKLSNTENPTLVRSKLVRQ